MVMEDLEQTAQYDDDPSSLNAAALSVLQRNKALKQILETKQKQRRDAKPSTGEKLKTTVKTGAEVLSKVAPDPKVKLGAKVVSTVLSDEELKQVYGEEGAYDALFAWMKREGLTSGLSKDRYIDAMKDNPDNFTKHVTAFKQAMDAGKPPQVKKAEVPKIETGKPEKTGEVKPFNSPEVDKDDPNILRTMDKMVGKDKKPDATEELLDSALPDDVDMDFNDDGEEDELDWEAFAGSLLSEVDKMKKDASQPGEAKADLAANPAPAKAATERPAAKPSAAQAQADPHAKKKQILKDLGEDFEEDEHGSLNVRNYFQDLKSLSDKGRAGSLADFVSNLGGALIKSQSELGGASSKGEYRSKFGAPLADFVKSQGKTSQERRLAEQAKSFLVESEGKRAELVKDIQNSAEYKHLKSQRAQMDFMVKMLTSFDQSQRVIAGQYFNRIGGQVRRSTVNSNV
jgi:uncharacterized protein YdbL (DUF1318 family)